MPSRIRPRGPMTLIIQRSGWQNAKPKPTRKPLEIVQTYEEERDGRVYLVNVLAGPKPKLSRAERSKANKQAFAARRGRTS